uniref:Uncharacterized protein n=1 Tax=Panagrolaimus superbus TaxID=310955 RepID=A0A914YF76_9BILA
MDNFLHYKDSCIDNDYMLSTQAGGTDTLDDEKLLNGFEMNDSNNSHDVSRIRISDNARLISASPQQEANLDLSNSLVDSVMNNNDLNFLEDNILQDPSLDDHPFNHVGTSFDLNDSNTSSSLQFNNTGLNHDYIQRQMQDEFEEQMERDAVAISEQSIPDTSFRSENLNESIEIDNQIPHTDFSEPVKDISTAENINSEAAILASISDYRIRFSPLPPSVLNELKLQRKKAKKAKKHDRREEYKEKRKPGLGKI